MEGGRDSLWTCAPGGLRLLWPPGPPDPFQGKQVPGPLSHSPAAVEMGWGLTEIPVTHNPLGPLEMYGMIVWEGSVGRGFEDVEEF